MAKYLRRNRAGSGISSQHLSNETYFLVYRDDNGQTKEFRVYATSRRQATEKVLSRIPQSWPEASFRTTPILMTASIIDTEGHKKIIHVNDMYPQNNTITVT